MKIFKSYKESNHTGMKLESNNRRKTQISLNVKINTLLTIELQKKLQVTLENTLRWIKTNKHTHTENTTYWHVLGQRKVVLRGAFLLTLCAESLPAWGCPSTAYGQGVTSHSTGSQSNRVAPSGINRPLPLACCVTLGQLLTSVSPVTQM